MQSGDIIGEKLGNFVILEKIGSGGMGSVYKARQMGLDRLVAVKVLKPDLVTQNRDFVKRFLREARTAALISHQNVVQIFTVGSKEQLYFIAMEFIEGESVGAKLDKRIVLGEKESVLMTLQAARGLKAAFEKGLIHRDIKPDNLLVAADGTVKVADFGLAKMVDVQSRVTREGVTIGTIAYMSPEQVKGEDLDFRSDIYSLGATLYHMLTGRQPFEADSAVSIAYKHINEPPVPLREINPALSAGIEAVVLRMMAKAPGDRHQSMDELIEDLDSTASRGHPASTDTTAYVGLGPRIERRSPTRGRAFVAGFVLLAAALLAVAAVLISGIPGGGNHGAQTGGNGTEPAAARLVVASPKDGAWLNSLQVAVSGECSGEIAGVTVNGTETSVKDGRFSVKLWLAAGDRRIAVEGVLASGARTRKEISVRIDTAPPEILISSPAREPGRTRENAFLLEGSVKEENPAGIVIDGAKIPNPAGDFKVPIPLSGNESKTVVVEAFDLAGNSARREVSILRDAKPPVITLVDFVQGGFIEAESNILRIRFRIDEEASRIRIQGRELEPAGLLYEAAIDLAEGVNSIPVEVEDLVGNAAKATVEISYRKKQPSGLPAGGGDFNKVLSALDKLSGTAEKIRILESFVAENPSSSAKEEAEEMLRSLRQRKADEDEQKAYDDALNGAQAQDSPFAGMARLKVYLTAHPGGKYSVKVGEMLELLRRKGLPQGVARTETEGEYLNEKDDAVMVLVPAGPFSMGSSREELLSLLKSRTDLDIEAYECETPLHVVHVDAFFMYKHEVSNSQFAKFLNEYGSIFDERKRQFAFEDPWGVELKDGRWRPADGKERHPAVQVTFLGAEKYAEWAGASLPSEAQWEKAASWDGQKNRRLVFPWGNEYTFGICNSADLWFSKTIVTQTEWLKYSRLNLDNVVQTRDVDSMPGGASPCGCLHMAGNVYEWCQDWYSDGFYKTPASRDKNPVNVATTFLRVVRGGCFSKAGLDCRNQRRFRWGQTEHSRTVGFRCQRRAD